MSEKFPISLLCDGGPWPFEPLLPNEARLEVSLFAGVVQIVIGCSIEQLNRHEKRQISSAAISVGMLAMPTFAWMTVSTNVMVFDAPFALPKDRAVADELLQAPACILLVAFLAHDTVKALRTCTMTKENWAAIRQALASCPIERQRWEGEFAIAKALWTPNQVDRRARTVARA